MLGIGPSRRHLLRAGSTVSAGLAQRVKGILGLHSSADEEKNNERAGPGLEDKGGKASDGDGDDPNHQRTLPSPEPGPLTGSPIRRCQTSNHSAQKPREVPTEVHVPLDANRQCRTNKGDGKPSELGYRRGTLPPWRPDPVSRIGAHPSLSDRAATS
jgi:hypothetical protein